MSKPKQIRSRTLRSALIRRRCSDAYEIAADEADRFGLLREVMLEALHETFVLSRERLNWSEDRVLRQALFAGLVEWDLWWPRSQTRPLTKARRRPERSPGKPRAKPRRIRRVRSGMHAKRASP